MCSSDKELTPEELLKDPCIIRFIDEAIHSGTFVGETINALYSFLVLLSAKSEFPLNLRPSGRSSTGKTEIIMQVAKLFPEDFVERHTGASSKALFYDSNAKEVAKGEYEVNFSNRAIVLLEENESMDFVRAIKPLLSHDTKESTYITVFGERKKTTIKYHLKGWFSYIGLTASSKRGEEEDTRATLITPTYGQQKYKAAILRYGALKSDFFEFVENLDDEDKKIFKTIRAAVKQLKPYKVYNPFANYLASAFPAKKARAMRDFKQFLSLIDTITLLHQYQRPYAIVDDSVILISTLADVKMGLQIAETVFADTIIGLETDIKQFYDFLCERYAEEDLTYKALQECYEKCFGEQIPRSTLRSRYVDKLIDSGLLEKDESKKPYKFVVSKKNIGSLADLIAVNPDQFVFEIEDLMKRVEIDNKTYGAHKIKFVPNEELAKRVVEDVPKEVWKLLSRDAKRVHNEFCQQSFRERTDLKIKNGTLPIDSERICQPANDIELSEPIKAIIDSLREKGKTASEIAKCHSLKENNISRQQIIRILKALKTLSVVGTSLDGNKKVYFLKGDSIANMTKTTNKKREDILEALIYNTIIKITQQSQKITEESEEDPESEAILKVLRHENRRMNVRSILGKLNLKTDTKLQELLKLLYEKGRILRSEHGNAYFYEIVKQPPKGAMIEVVVNRIARQHDFTKEEVQRKIDEMIANGNLGVERDELGMAYVKVM